MCVLLSLVFFFFFNDTATTEIYTLSLHDALPICSQNDQDTRPRATLLEMPMLEPSTPAEAFRMMVEAFDLSERFQTPVILRETRSFAQSSEPVELPQTFPTRTGRGTCREPWRFVPVPRNVVA